jgi:hypothetical protein
MKLELHAATAEQEAIERPRQYGGETLYDSKVGVPHPHVSAVGRALG